MEKDGSRASSLWGTWADVNILHALNGTCGHRSSGHPKYQPIQEKGGRASVALLKDHIFLLTYLPVPIFS